MRSDCKQRPPNPHVQLILDTCFGICDGDHELRVELRPSRFHDTSDMTGALSVRQFTCLPLSRTPLKCPRVFRASHSRLPRPRAAAAAEASFHRDDLSGSGDGTGESSGQFQQAPEWVKLVVIILTSAVVAFFEFAICRRAFRMLSSNQALDTVQQSFASLCWLQFHAHAATVVGLGTMWASCGCKGAVTKRLWHSL